MSRTRVAIVGPGRVGTLLAAAFARAGRRVVAVSGGTPEARHALQAQIAGVRDLPLAAAVDAADLVVLAVPDDAVATTVRSLARMDAVQPSHQLIHVAGSLGLEPLVLAARAGASVAACHPAMTVPTGTIDPDHLVGVRWAVTAAPRDRDWAHELVVGLGGEPIEIAPDRRVLYHAALTVGSNGVAAATATARQLLHAAGVDDPGPLLASLAHASVDAALASGAAGVTGPVARGDVGTVIRHLEVLQRDVGPLAERYRLVQQLVLDTVGPALAAEDRAALAESLAVTATDHPR